MINTPIFHNADMKHSPWGGMSHTLDGKFAFCKIYDVDEKKGLVSIKTYGSAEQSMNDRDFTGVEFLAMDAHPDGDQSGSIPRRGAHGVVIFIGGTPAVIGFRKVLHKDTGGVYKDKEANVLSEGDKVLGTVGGARVLVRSGGVIEIQASDICRQYFIPGEEIMQAVCKIYELYTDGGSIKWNNTGGNPVCNFEFKNKTNVFFMELGSVDLTTIARFTGGIQIQPQEPAPVPTFEALIKATGAFELNINKAALKISISPTGSLDITSIGGNINVTTATGNVNVEAISGNIAIKSTAGKIDLTSKLGDISAKTTAGAINIEGLNCTVNALAACTIKAKSTLAVECAGPLTVKSSSTVNIEALSITIKGAGAMGKALVYPFALSDFTGLPIKPPSSSVSMTG